MSHEEKGRWGLQGAFGSSRVQANPGKVIVHHNISSPVVHNITVQIVLVLMLMGGLAAHLVDLNGAFLLGQFKPTDRIYMKIPLGFEKFYPLGGLLFFKCTLYGVKNAAKTFWKLLLGCRILGLTALNSLLQYVNWLVWEVCSVN